MGWSATWETSQLILKSSPPWYPEEYWGRAGLDRRIEYGHIVFIFSACYCIVGRWPVLPFGRRHYKAGVQAGICLALCNIVRRFRRIAVLHADTDPPGNGML